MWHYLTNGRWGSIQVLPYSNTRTLIDIHLTLIQSYFILPTQTLISNPSIFTELDFLNEASNQQRLGDLLTKEGVDGVYVPKVYNELCTRRLMVSEWIDGTKLSDCSPQLVNEVSY